MITIRVKFYANMVKRGIIKLKDVPEKYRNKVQAFLKEQASEE